MPHKKNPPHPGFDRMVHHGAQHPGFEALTINPSHKGKLHRDLGISADDPIPEARLKEAEHSTNPKVRKRAQFADNMRKRRRS